jgi:hypothetical protein
MDVSYFGKVNKNGMNNKKALMLSLLGVLGITLIVVLIMSLLFFKEVELNKRVQYFQGDWIEHGVKKGYKTTLTILPTTVKVNGKTVSTLKMNGRNSFSFKYGHKEVNCDLVKGLLNCDNLAHYSPMFKKKQSSF